MYKLSGLNSNEAQIIRIVVAFPDSVQNEGMKRIALLIFLSALSSFSFYCAFSPEAGRIFPLAIRNERFRRLVYKLMGTIFLLSVLLLLYGALMPALPEE